MTLGFATVLVHLAVHAVPLGVEAVRLCNEVGQILAQPVHSAIDIPRYDCAAMDGFGVHYADLAAGRRRWNWLEPTIRARPEAAARMGRGGRIITAACMPHWADRVPMQEVVRRDV